MAKNRRKHIITLPHSFKKIRNLFDKPWFYALGWLACVLFASAIAVFRPFVIKWRIEQETLFTNGTETYRKLVNLTVPVFFNVRVFNITNPDALEKGEKFILKELGPYVYEDRRQKNVLSENHEEGTITFLETKTYIFRPDLSNGSEHDLVNTINFPFLTTCTVLTRYIMGMPNFLLETLDETMVMRNVPVGDLIFKGVALDPMYEILHELNPKGYHKQFSDNTFAYFNKENKSDTGEYKTVSGVKGYKDFGEIVTWKGKNELDFWTDKSAPSDQQYCNWLNGSDGSLNAPFVTKDRTVYFYYTHLCRSMPLKYEKEITYKGIKGWGFRMPHNVFDGPDKVPENKCFCQNPGGGLQSECIDGVYRVFECYMDAPLVLSKPHFLDGDKRLTEDVEGLNPNRDLHDSIYELEPLSGMLLKASIKIQLNAELQPLPGVTNHENLPHVFVPTLWIELLSSLDEENLNFLTWHMVIPLALAFWLQWIAVVFSGLMLVSGIYVACKKPRKITEARVGEMEPISQTEAHY